MIIPTRNRAAYLKEALRTALDQEGVSVEVIVVDDASEDSTADFLASMPDPRVRSLRFDRNVGMGAARNAALALARGKWVAFLDDDDLWDPQKLRSQFDAARREGAAWVYCGVLLVTPEGAVIRLSGPPQPEDLLDQLLRTNVVRAGSSTVVVDADRLRAVGGFDESFDFVGDWDLWIRLAVADRAAAVAEPLAAYRRHSSSYSSVGQQRARGEVGKLMEKHAALLLDRGISLEGEHLLSWLDLERDDARRAEALAHARAGRRFAAIRLQLTLLAATRSWRDLRRLVRFVMSEAVLRRVRRDQSASRDETADVPDWLAAYAGVGPNSRLTATVGSAVATSARAKKRLKP